MKLSPCLSAVFVFASAFHASAAKAEGSCQTPDVRFSTVADGCLDAESGLIWSDSPGFLTDYAGADEFCRVASAENFPAWRLPSPSELKSMVKSPLDWAHLTSVQATRFYWMAAPETAARAQLAMPSTDASVAPEEAYENKAGFRGGVLCVRRAFGCTRDDDVFQTVAGGCRHTSTGLTWSTMASRALAPRLAVNYCASLVEGGSAGWRLPTTAELSSIAGPGKAETHLSLSSGDRFWSTDTDSRLIGFGDARYYQQFVNLGTGKVTTHTIGDFHMDTSYWKVGPDLPALGVLCVR